MTDSKSDSQTVSHAIVTSIVVGMLYCMSPELLQVARCQSVSQSVRQSDSQLCNGGRKLVQSPYCMSPELLPGAFSPSVCQTDAASWAGATSYMIDGFNICQTDCQAQHFCRNILNPVLFWQPRGVRWQGALSDYANVCLTND